MKLIALLAAFLKLIDRALDRLDEFDKQRKQMQREERRASVQANPDQAFTDLFGKPSNVQLHKPINRQAINDPMRADLSTTTVDKDGKRPSDNA